MPRRLGIMFQGDPAATAIFKHCHKKVKVNQWEPNHRGGDYASWMRTLHGLRTLPTTSGIVNNN